MPQRLPADGITLAEYGVAYVLVVALALWVVVRGPGMLRALRVPRALLGALVLVGVAHLVVVTLAVPHAVWHTNNHDFEKLPGFWTHHAFMRGTLGIHGATPYAVYRLVAAVVPGGLELPFHLTAVLASLTLPLFGVLLWAETGRARLAVAAPVLLALVPARLRMAATLDFFVLFELLLVLALVLAEVWSRTRRAEVLVGLVVALGLAMACHLEMLLAGPLILGLHLLARDRQAFWLALGHPAAWLAGVVALAPHLVYLVDQVSGGRALPTIEGAGTSIMSVQGLVFSTLLVALWAVASRFPAAPEGRASGRVRQAVVGALLLAAAGRAWVLPAYEGLDPAGVPCVTLKLHAETHTTLTPWTFGLLLAAGVWWTVRHERATFLRLTLPALPLVLLYAENADSHSSVVRFATGTGVLLAGLHLRGADALAGVFAPGTRRAATLAGVVGVVAVSVVPHATWIGWTFPQQAEQPLLLAAVHRVDAGARVASLGASDLPRTGLEGFDVGGKDYVRGMLAGRADDITRRGQEVVGLGELLADPGQVERGEVLWFRGASCFRVDAAFDPVGRVEALLLGGRRVRVHDPRTADDLFWTRCGASTRKQFELTTLAPCWHRLDDATCVSDGPDGCALWELPSACDPAPPYEDPRCAEVAEAFTLEVVAERPVPVGNESMPTLAVQREGAVMGLYRLRPRER